MSDTIFIIHHLLQQRLVARVDRRNGDVTHSTKLSAVVQMLVLQTKEIPHKSPTNTLHSEWHISSGVQLEPALLAALPSICTASVITKSQTVIK